MTRFTKFLVTAFAIILAATTTSTAQLDQGSFGVGALFAGSSQLATGHFALGSNMDVGVGLGFNQESYSSDQEGYEAPDALTTLFFQGMFRYFLSKGKDVSPYVGGILAYYAYPTEEGNNYKETQTYIAFGGIFGGQVFIAKGLALYAQIALSYGMDRTAYETSSGGGDYTWTTSTISLRGSGVGAVFYFN